MSEVAPTTGKLKFDGNVFQLDALQLGALCDGQAKLYWQAAERLSGLKYEAEVLEADISFKKADLALRIYRNPLDFDFDRASEEKVKFTIAVNPEILELNKRLMTMHYQIDQLTRFLTALDHRKRMLELKVDLQGQGYYAEPRTTPKTPCPTPQKPTTRTPRQHPG